MPETDLAAIPFISVIVPVFNGAEFLGRCLDTVFASDYPSFEVIVIDDHSVDDSVAIAQRFPCIVREWPVNVGSAAARNIGAQEARGSVFFFLDADILVKPDTLRTIAEGMSDAGIAALFGSYGRATVPTRFFPRYKNLVHHYTHQCSREEASTFCSGFGAIRREAFQKLGGFDPYCRFLEDIELGYRMNREGLRVRLCKNLQLTHCKNYTLASLIRSDVFGRAVPWTRLIIKTGIVKNDLNTRWNNVLSVLVSFLLLLTPALPAPVLSALVLSGILIALNSGFLFLTYSEGGLAFALQACLMCWFSYLYSGAGLLIGIAAHFGSQRSAVVDEPIDLPES